MVPMGAGQHGHHQPRVSSSMGGGSQSFAGLLGMLKRAGEGAELRGSDRKSSWTLSDQKAFGILTIFGF